MALQPLNPRQERFCREYLVDLNAAEAYKRAGYQVKNNDVANAAASRLLADVRVQSLLKQLKLQHAEFAELSAEKVIHEYVRVGFSNITDVIEFSGDSATVKDSKKLSPDVSAAIASVQVVTTTDKDGATTVKHTVRMHDKLKALDSLSEHLGLRHDLNWAWKVLENYGFKRVQSDRGYELIDTYAEANDSDKAAS